MSAIRSITIPRTIPLAVVAVAALVGACSNSLLPPAQQETLTDTATVYALSGSPPGAPTALYIYGRQLLIASPSFGFDVAFDIDTAGRAVLLPVRTLVSALTSSGHQVGLQQLSNTTFDALTDAPVSGYHYDSAMVVTPGVTVAIDSHDPLACSTSIYAQSVYGKVEILSVDAPAHLMHIRFGVDPNCGYRSFAVGIPSS